MKNNIESGGYLTPNDFQNFINNHGIKSNKEFRENYGTIYNRYIKHIRKENRNLKFSEEYYHTWNELTTVLDFQNFIKSNNIQKPVQFRKQFPKEYDRLCRILSHEDKLKLVYPNKRNSFEKIINLEDLQTFIKENQICNRKDLHKRFSGLYVKFQNQLDQISFEKTNISIGENKIKLLLEENNINFIYQKTFPGLKNRLPLRFDFYISDGNILIEHHGEGHFGKGRYFSEELIKSDKIKYKFALDNNINLMYFTIYKSEYKNLGYFTEVITDINVLLEKIKNLMTKTN